MDQRLIYKIVPRSQWVAAQASGTLGRRGIDQVDGYIHLSTASQFDETLAKHFAGQTDLIRLDVRPDLLGDTLRWEPSRGGQLFPHVYGEIPLEAIVGARSIPDDRAS